MIVSLFKALSHKNCRVPRFIGKVSSENAAKPLKITITNAAAESHRHRAAERNALDVVAFQQLDDRLTAKRPVLTYGAIKLQPTGTVGPYAAPMKTLLFRYQIAV